ncbi:hypothetical protein [Streptomyces sp. NPDC051662]|uniref:hypothetical protein n=1 Tax=Streptomyces sp. NPDC051662 TaxID=3154750 RepID=UPI00343976C1
MSPIRARRPAVTAAMTAAMTAAAGSAAAGSAVDWSLPLSVGYREDGCSSR